MYEFHITIHARPVAAAPGPLLNLKGRDVQTLAISPEVVGATMMDRTFEAASEALASLERMYCEPDGSFVWVSSQAEDPWQVDGNLYDRNERLLFVDLKGSCPGSRFDELLKALGWPQTALVFQLTRQAVFLDEAEFRRFAETSES